MSKFTIPSIPINGYNSFLDKTTINDNNSIIIEKISRIIETKLFYDFVKSNKNIRYYYEKKIIFEQCKEINDIFNIYIESPLSIVQGFMLGIISILN